jgi:hypothetical protein
MRHLGWPGAALVLLAWAEFYQGQIQGFPTVAMAPLNNLLDLGLLPCWLRRWLRESTGCWPSRRCGWRG